jgi:WD40 repeat protein
LTISLSASDVATAGTYPVVVTNPPPGGGPSTPFNLTLFNSRIDFSTLPDTIDTNLGTFFVSGRANPGDAVAVNGASVPLDSVGNFVIPFTLIDGANRIELDIHSAQNGDLSFVKTVTFDPTLSTAGTRLLYVSSIAPAFSGTIVIDVDNNVFLGFIPKKHVRGISPDAKQIYMDDLSVISTASHQVLPSPSSPLTFSQPIPSDGFLVSPDGTRLYSRNEVLNVATNQVLPVRLPVNIETGWPFAGPNQGGPAISPDGKEIFCGPSACQISGLPFDILRINTADNSITATGIQVTPWLSDLAITPDGRFLLVSSYSAGGNAIYDANSFQLLSPPSLSAGDFAGQVAVSNNGTRAIFGSAGNPATHGGTVVLASIPSGVVYALAIDLADHLAVSDQDFLFVSSGDTPGVAVWDLQNDAYPGFQREFVLGINQIVTAVGFPQNDDIEKIVFKR